MNQEQITICFMNGQEESYTKDYTAIMDELSQKDKAPWMLFDYCSYTIIDQNRLELPSKLIAMNVKEVKGLQKTQLDLENLIIKHDKIKKECNEYKQKAPEYDKIQKASARVFLKEYDFQEKCNQLEQQIIERNETIEDLIGQLQMNEKYQKEITEENTKRLQTIENGKTEYLELKSKYFEQSNRLQTLSQQNQQLSQQNQQLSQESNQKSNNLILQIRKLEQDQQTTSQIIQQLRTEKYESVQYLSILQGNEQSQKIAQTNNQNQIKFLEDFVKKKCDDQVSLNSVIINQNKTIFDKVDVFEITLNDEQFPQQKLYFINQGSYLEQLVSDINYQDFIKQKQQFKIKITKQELELDIEKVGVDEFYKSKNEALNVIFNLLLVERYVKLFKKMDPQFEIWNLKMPRQFLINDKLGNYYIYKESFKNTQDKDFIPFKKSKDIDQYISSFFSYFYFSTNQNFALSNCKIKKKAQKDNQQNKEIVISSIVIHSKFKKGYSQLDEGMDKIKEFEYKQSKGPPGTTQKYWPNDQEKKAQKTWIDQFN